MGAMTSVVIGPTPAGVNFGSVGNVRAPGISPTLIPFSAKMSASYATGGDTITMPSTEIAGRQVLWIDLSPSKYGANRYNWNGSQTAPKIQAYSAFDTEVANATDLSAVTVQGLMLLGG